MKKNKKRIISGVLAAVMFFSTFLQSSAAYAAETEDIPELKKVTFSVGDHGRVGLTDDSGKQTVIEQENAYVLECEKGTVWDMEISADQDYEIAQYTILYSDGRMEVPDPNETEEKETLSTKLEVTDDLKINVDFSEKGSVADDTGKNPEEDPGDTVNIDIDDDTGTETVPDDGDAIPEETAPADPQEEEETEPRTSESVSDGNELPESGTAEDWQDGLYGYQSEGYVRTTIIPDSSEEMLVFFTDSTGRMARAAASGSVSLVRGASYVYPSYWGSRSGSHRFTLNGSVAFCANPQEAEPGDGTYPSAYGTVSTTTNDTVLRVLSFGYGGANDCTAEYLASLGRDTADDTRYALTHVAVAAAFGDSNPFYRANAACQSDVMGFLSYVSGLRFDSTGMYAQYVEVSGMQAIIRIVGDVRQEQNVDLTIKKRSVTDLSAGRGEMLLTGAVFQLYGWDGSVPGYTRYICDSTDNGDGAYTFRDVDISQGDGGHFLVKEKTAPKGYEKTYYNFNDNDAINQTGYGGRQFVYENGSWSCNTLSDFTYPSWGFIFLDYPKQKQITVTKVDAGTNEKLTGAEFTLYGWNAAAKAYDINLGKFKDNGDGTYTSQKFAIDRADSRKYLVKETKAPAGYTLSSADTTDSDFKNYGGRQITLDADGNITGSPNLTFKNESDRGAVKIKKTSANPELTKDSTCYSFEGAEFGVYSDEDCKTSVGTLVTDKNGDTEELSLRPGTYWIKETKAPTGYALDPNAKKAEVTGNKTVTVTFADVPQGDPATILLGKVDKDTNSNKPEGSASLENAEFTVKYYDGFYTAEDLPEEAARSWVLKTNGNGYCALRDTYKISGDEFYFNTTGMIMLPLGTITIQETKAPEGYLINDEVFVRQITSEGTAETVYTYNDPIIPETVIRGGVSIEKWDYERKAGTAQGDASLEGAEFTIINRSENPVIVDGESYAKGETVMAIVTDENGKASTKADTLPYGDYRITETNAPEGYLLEGNNLTQDFSIRENGKIVELTGEEAAAQDSVIRGGVSITKWDADLMDATPQGNGTMEGAIFAIRNKSTGPVMVNGREYEPESVVLTIKTDKTGVATTEANVLPYGIYEMVETKAPTGYLQEGANLSQIFTIRENGTIVRLNTEDTAAQNEVIRGGISITKWDLETMAKVPQGAASLKGAEFTITNQSIHPVVVNGKSYAKGESVMVITTNSSGVAATGTNTLPYGDYRITETKAPEGYLPEGNNLTQDFSIRENGITVQFHTKDTTVQDQVIRGGVSVAKWDMETMTKAPQGNASLQGAEFTITNQSIYPVVVNGKSYAKGETVIVITSDESGVASTGADTLPYGDYQITETKAPEGYLLEGNNLTQDFSIRENGKIVQLADKDTAVQDQIIRGGVRIEKWDYETKENAAQGGATIEGAEFTIINRSENPVIVDGESYATGEAVLVIATDETGAAETKADALPYGTYQIAETKAPEGYLASGANLTQTFTIRENGKVVNLNTGDTAAQNQVKRGDFQIIKAAAKTYERMANVVFTITSKTTGESHAFVTDANGYYSTESCWNPHTRNTNRGETSEDGIWFGTSEPDDTKGALLYDTYTIEEQPCEANKGYELITFDIVISRDNVTVDLGTVTDELIPVISIQTTASVNGTGSSVTHAVKDLTVNDRVSYVNLTAGEKYTVKGTVMDKETGEPLLVNGEEVTAEKIFTPKESNGGVDMEFTFDASGFAGHKLVVFEKLYLGKQEIASHEDWEDEDQTIEILNPEIGTQASDQATGSHIGHASGEVTIVDKVTYTGLIPGKTYQVKGTLMDKESGEPLLVNEEEVTSEKEFTAVTGNGSIELTFTFDGLALKGKAVVAFEKLLYEGKEIAVHTDIGDEEQTVEFPETEIETEAVDQSTGSHEGYAAEKVTIIDQVSYTGLIEAQEYTVRGILMDKETEAALIVNGREVTAEKTFTAQKPDGSVELTFTFDASALKGKEVVVFETLYHDGKEIAVHTDITDEGQTVEFKEPEIGTKATDALTGTHQGHALERVTVTDAVSYSDLIEGKEYTVKGTLMDKETGKALLVDGKEVTAEKTFTAEKPDGSVELSFTFDGLALKGKAVVAFEKLLYEGKEIAVHEDLTDEEQTVTYPEPTIGTTALDKASGTHEAEAAKEMAVTDTVNLTGLIKGEEYTVRGKAWDYETRQPLLINGKEVVSEFTFTAEGEEGTVTLTFDFDGSELAGKKLVFCEILYYEGQAIAEESSLENKDQTISITEKKNKIGSIKTSGGSSGNSVKTGVVKTGDSTDIIGYAVLMALAVLLIVVFLVNKRKKDHEKMEQD